MVPRALMGIALIGVTNFTVSFILALWVARAARGIEEHPLRIVFFVPEASYLEVSSG
jgi:site-specific recombinase